MKRRGGRGSSMRSVVGFLSQRGLEGDPLLTHDFQRRRLRGCRNLYKKDLLGHFGCVNAIEFSNNGGQWLVSGGDDRRVLLWHMEEAIHSRVKPVQLKGEHHSNIFCLAFNSGNTKVFSGGNDEQVILHDVESTETLDVFAHEDAVYGLSVSPVNDNIFASSSDDGRVLIWDIRESSHGEPFCLAHYPSAFHSVMFNPVEPRLLATANSKEGVGLWDIRKPQSSLLRYGGNLSLQSAMSVRFNSNGTQLLALRRRLPPVLYDIHCRLPVFQFDNQGYFNSCTMKSCCFAGDRDQYILSGSDDFNLYMWRIPPDPEAGGIGRVVNGAFMVLKGHRSIVNQVRFNPHTYMICSSGVEKIIKIWSPYKQPDCTGDLDGRIEDDSRCLYTHEEYISLVLNSGSGLSHDYANQSVQEDPRMMAFFDSLVRREIEGWSSDSDSDLSESTILQLHAGVSERSAYSESESSTSLRHSPPHVAEENDEAAYNLRALRATESPSAREDAASRQQRLSALRKYQDKRLLALSNESDSEDNACEAELETDLFPRPRSPSPEENESSSSSSSSSSTEDEEELNERRTSTRQRNALRRRQKAQKEERTSTNTQSATPYVGEDVYDYPQIKLDDASSSPASSPERSSANKEVVKERPSPCSDSESVERKIYKAYKWLHYSYIYSAGKDGESSRGEGENDEGKPGTSGRHGTAHSLSKEDAGSVGSVVPQGSPALPAESHSRENVKECVSIESPSNGRGHERDNQRRTEGQDSTSEDTSGGGLEHSFDTKKLNGKANCKGLNNCTEEPCVQTAALAEQRNSQNCQPAPSHSSPVPPFPTAAIRSSCSRNSSEAGEDRSPDASCLAHNNGHLHLRPSCFNNGQSQAEQESVPQGLPAQAGPGWRRDCCLSDTDSSGRGPGAREEAAAPRPAGSDSARALGALKRHRAELEDADSEGSSLEKKLKT
ncbi:DDB1- and CUL4-associated factor 5 isoform X1 [Colius striatus]|uniref:DDB1- and CUL4-associated factor 5 isoform X1 n=1 Tax=Colius striatus TaxID=57412 RepID=UPI002B1DAD85|nr:DDB1- and CUL4-associated factor 5 isoform X1 [Colius striatus]